MSIVEVLAFERVKERNTTKLLKRQIERLGLLSECPSFEITAVRISLMWVAGGSNYT
ncbi:MAG: hypothetical protein M3297_15095 [Thermoproteota archaeon]|nr:hypothetical protein [Thermoproteota archaeon]